MSLRWLVIAIAALFVATIGWRYRDALLARDLSAATPAPPPRIEFDNGSNRDATTTKIVVPRQAATGPRKCAARDGSVSYTDGNCPPGTRELTLGKGPINVVPAQRPPPAAASAPTTPGMADRYVEQLTQQR